MESAVGAFQQPLPAEGVAAKDHTAVEVGCRHDLV